MSPKSARGARAPKLSGAWDATDKVLAQPALRARLEAKYAKTEDDALKRAMLMDALAKTPWLKAWLERRRGAVTVGMCGRWWGGVER